MDSSKPGLEVLLVRHAHADWVPDEARPLSAQGLRDAEEVAELLLSCAPERIYSSPYPRAVQTVEPLASRLGLEIEIVDGLRERTLADGAVADFDAALEASWADLDLSFPGGESSREAMERFSAAFNDVVSRHDKGTIAIGTHGNVFGLLLHQSDAAYGHEFWYSMTWPDVYRLSLDCGRIIAVERLWKGPPE